MDSRLVGAGWAGGGAALLPRLDKEGGREAVRDVGSPGRLLREVGRPDRLEREVGRPGRLVRWAGRPGAPWPGWGGAPGRLVR